MPNTIHHLEMTSLAQLCEAREVKELEVSLVDPPRPDLNKRFYRTVGGKWQWTDRLSWSAEKWIDYASRPELHTYLGRLAGQDIGYFELEQQDQGNVEVALFGLLPDYIGKGLGGAFLTQAVEEAWRLPETRRVWLHTCTFDHEYALTNYEKRGFRVFKVEE